MWFFNSPEIIYGEGALGYLDDLQGQRAFIVTDPVLHQLGFTAVVAEHLRTAGLAFETFHDVEPEPCLETIYQGAEAIRQFAPDWIIGLGGGSAMDAAKAMWVLYERPELRPDEINPMVRLGLGQKAHLITIPTTAGTGAECTWAVVLTDKAEDRKIGLGSRETLATVAIVDPALTAQLPARITADTGMDVLVHAVEGYTSRLRNDFTDGLCLKATELVFAYLPRAVADGSDAEAREKMANAAAIAGLGFSNAMLGIAHAMGHAFGAVFHLPHGRCVGTFLPYTMEFEASVIPERYVDIGYFLRLPVAGPQRTGRELTVAIQGLMRAIGQPTNVQEMGVDRDQYAAALDRLCDLAEQDTQVVMSERVPSRQELADLYRYAYEGRSVDF